jgi:hypothetical protein
MYIYIYIYIYIWALEGVFSALDRARIPTLDRALASAVAVSLLLMTPCELDAVSAATTSATSGSMDQYSMYVISDAATVAAPSLNGTLIHVNTCIHRWKEAWR